MATQEFIHMTGERWKERITNILGSAPPRKASWHGARDIALTLNAMAGNEIGHLFFPDGGGNDLKSARLSKENRCIEIHAGTVSVIQPVKLTFHRIPRFIAEWSFFHLTAMQIQESGIYDEASKRRSYEPLTEYPDGTYDDYECSQSGYRDGADGPEAIPDGTRTISRYIKPAKFVLFCKGSLYNIREGRALTGDTYDGRHNTMSEDEFLDLVQQYALATP